MKKYIIVLFLIIIPISSAFARLGDGIDINGYLIHMMADFGVGYDDNVLLTPTDEQDDYFYNLKSYIDFEKEITRDGKIYLSYETDFYRYDELDTEDSDNHYLIGGINLMFNDFYIKLRDEYVDTSNINGILFTNRIDRVIHDPSILIGIELNKIALEGRYEKHYRRYDSDIYNIYDHDIDTLAGTLIYHAFTKTNFLLEYETSDIDYKRSERDGDYEQIKAGIKGDITSKITGTIWCGYQDRNYDIGGQSYDNPISEINLDYKITDEYKLNLNYLLTANESIIERNNYYEIDRIAIDFSRDSERGLLFSFGGFIEWDDFPFQDGINRKDKVENLFIRVGYEFKEWLAIELKWDYQKRDSNLNEEDYTQNNFFAYFSFVL